MTTTAYAVRRLETKGLRGADQGQQFASLVVFSLILSVVAGGLSLVGSVALAVVSVVLLTAVVAAGVLTIVNRMAAER